VIGVDYHGVVIPLFFNLLPKTTKKGNSKTKHRLSLLKICIEVVGVENIICFSGDREFIGEEWFNYLVEKNIPFAIRIKENFLIKRPGSNHTTSVKSLFRNIRNGRRKTFKKTFNIWGLELYISVSKNSKGELMVIASNINTRHVLKYYLKRWSIELLFKYLKKNGFNIEDTHITTDKKLKSMFLILTISVVWAMKTSQHIKHKQALKKSSHGRRKLSFFRRGLKAIRNSIFNLTRCIENFMRYVHLLISDVPLEVLLRGVQRRKVRKITSRMMYEPL